jgi:hypothetical protein
MVWSFSMNPLGSSYPSAEIVEGSKGPLVLEDETPDGGVALRGSSTAFSGRRVKPETLPKVIRWKSRQKIGDFADDCRHTVSSRLRALIEEIEPGVHQFEPIKFLAKDGSFLEDRWFWQICNRIDSVNRQATKMILRNGVIWAADFTLPENEQGSMVFDTLQIGSAKFWHDKHVGAGNFCTDDVREILDKAKITGLRYRHFEQV